MNMQPTTPAAVPAAHPLRIPSTIGYFAAFVALGLVGASLGPTLPGLADHTQSQLSQISFLFAARSLGYLLGSVVGGQLYDRIPAHPVMAAVLILMAFFLALVPIIPWLALLIFVLLLAGMAEGALDVGGNTVLVWLHDQDVGPYMNALHFFFGVGAFLSPIIIAQALLASGDINWAYWALALLMLPPAAWLLRLRSPQSQASRLAGRSLRVDRLLVALCALFLFLYVGAEIGFGGWIFTYIIRLGLAQETTAAYLTSAFWGSLTLGRLVSIPITTRLRPRTILLADVLGCLASVGIIIAWPDSLAAVWIGTLGLGFSMASIFPVTISLAGRRMTITGAVTSLFFVGASLGSMTLPWLIGQFFNTIGPQITMIAIVIDLALALVIYAALITYSGQPAGAHE